MNKLRLQTFITLVLALTTIIGSAQKKEMVNQDILSLLPTSGVNEQCKSDQRHEFLMETDAGYVQKRNEIEKQYQKLLADPNLAEKQATVYTIPVVVHVIHLGESVGTGTNISDAQVQSAISNLNDAYSGNTGLGYTGFDTDIEFCLAVRDPSGNPTTGINRVDGSGTSDYSTEGITNDDGSSQNETTIKALSKWSNADYYNIWVVAGIDGNMGGGGVQGYAYFPGAGSSVDGAVVLYNSFGYDPDGSNGYNLKSYTDMNVTTIHELGHGLNLYHTFQGDNDGANCPSNGNCSSDGDRICDVPPHIRSSSDCNTGGTNSCDGGSSNELFVHNFMDYSSDACQTEFTSDQSTRMRAAIDASRSGLLTSDGCTPVNTYDVALEAIVAPNGNYCKTTFDPVVTIKNYGSATLTSATITYDIDGGTAQVYNWTGSLTASASEDVTLNSMTTTAASHTFNAATSLPNGETDEYQSNDANSSSFDITVASLPYAEDFEGSFLPSGWSSNSADGAGTGWGSAGIKEWVSRAASGNGSSTTAAAINCYDYNMNTGTIDELISEAIDLNVSSPELTFNVSYGYYGSSNYERLRVLVSTDCGVNYTSVYDKSYTTLATVGQQGSSWTPSSSTHWRLETVDLSAYAGESVVLKWEVTNGYGNNVYIDDILIQDNCTPPAITSNPSNSTICEGENTSFSVTATDATGYQWQVDTGSGFGGVSNGGVYSGASSSTLTITGATAGMNGYNYRCVATGSCSPDATSNSASLTVNDVPGNAGTITGSTSECANATGVSYSISAVTGATTYTWSVPSGATVASGQGTTGITVDFGTSSGDVTVTPSNNCGDGGSNSKSITINPLPGDAGSITGLTSVCEGDTATYSISAVANATGYDWTVPSDATIAADFGTSIEVIFGSSSGDVTVTPTNSCGDGGSSATSVSVNSGPSISGHPSNSTINENDNTSFSVTATDATGYQWQVDQGGGFGNVTDGGVYSGATTATLSLTSVPLSMDGYIYRCVVTGNCGSVTSNSATLAVTGGAPGPCKFSWSYDNVYGKQWGLYSPTTNTTVFIVPKKISGVSTYELEINDASDFSGTSYTRTGSGPTPVQSDYYFSGLPANTTWYVRYRVDGGNWGEVRQFTTHDIVEQSYVLKTIDRIYGTNAPEHLIELFVVPNKVESALSYLVEVNDASDFTGTSFTRTGSGSDVTQSDYYFSGLSYGTIYYTRVSIDGGSFWGAVKSFKTTTVGRTNMRYTSDETYGQQWAANYPSPTATALYVVPKELSDVTSYTVEIDPDSNFTAPIVKVGTGPTVNYLNYRFDSLLNSTTYYVRVGTNIDPYGRIFWFTTEDSAVARTANPNTQVNMNWLEDKISVFPNPFTNQINIRVDSKKQENLMVRITDLTGKTVYQSTMHQTNQTISVGEEFDVGMYLIQLIHGDESELVKVIKQ